MFLTYRFSNVQRFPTYRFSEYKGSIDYVVGTPLPTSNILKALDMSTSTFSTELWCDIILYHNIIVF